MNRLPDSYIPGPLVPNGGGPGNDESTARPISVYVRYFSGIVKRHVLLVAGVTAAIGSAVGWHLWRTPEQYVSRAVIRIDDARGALTEGIDGGSRGTRLAADFLQTQIEILTSRQVLSRAVDGSGVRLQLRESGTLDRLVERLHVAAETPPGSFVVHFEDDGVTVGDDDVRARYGELVTYGGAQFIVRERPERQVSMILDILSRDAAIGHVASRLRVTPRRQTNIVDVFFRSESPTLATDMVNRIVDAFVAVDTEIARQEATRRREFLERQVAANDSLLEQTQLALSRFRVQNRLTSGTGRAAAHQSALVDVELRRSELEGRRRHYQALLTELNAATQDDRRDRLRVLMASPEITTNPVIDHVYSQMLAYEVARDTLLTRWRPEHPEVQHLDRLVSTLESQVIEAIRGHVMAIESQIETLTELRQSTAGEIAASALPPEAEVMAVQLEGQVETIKQTADLVRAEYQRARIEEAVEAGLVQVLDQPTAPGRPVETRQTQVLAIALMLGLMAGTGLAHLRESLDTSIHVREDLEATAQIPTLATVPRLLPNGRGRRFRGTPDEARVTPGTVNGRGRYLRGREAFRMLGTSLVLSPGGRDEAAPRTVLVTSALPGEGKTTTVANLAVAQAEAGQRVLVIDCDTSRPMLHELFAIGRSPGLVQVLRGQVPIEAAVRATRLGPAVLPAGDTDSDEALALNRVQMLALTRELADSFDVIILDAPPVLVMANAGVLATIADAVLLVVRSGQTDRAAAQYTVQQLRLVGAPLVGMVLNDADGDLERYAGAYYGTEYYGHE